MINNSIETNQREVAPSKVVAVIGRWMPIHNGHKRFLVGFAKDPSVKKLIIMIGSCNVRSSIKYCITATEREKMIRAVMNRENIPESKYEIVPVRDYNDFDSWILDVVEVCHEHHVTHFCTGNKEEILDVLDANQIDLGMEIINPENESVFPYHATQIRQFIVDGNYEEVNNLIPNEIKPILFGYPLKEILAASNKRTIDFKEGRQTVDTILLVVNSVDGKLYALLGKRPKYKVDFPDFWAFPGGEIRNHETAINAAIRVFYEETGLRIKMLDNSLEPAIIRFEDLPNNMQQMCVNGIYGSDNANISATHGGSTQCFTIIVEGNIEDYRKLITPQKELLNVNFVEVKKITRGDYELAFQHKEMLDKAISMCFAYPNLHLLN